MKVSDSPVSEAREPARPRRAPVPRVHKTFFYQKVIPAALIVIAAVTLLTLIVALLAVAGLIHF